MTMTPSGYHLRQATEADIPTIVDHRILMFGDMGVTVDEVELRRAFAQWLRDHMPCGVYRAWLAADSDGSIAAGAGITLLPWPPGRRELSGRLPIMYNVYTAPAHRRRGLGRSLVGAVHAWCRAQGYRSIGLAATTRVVACMNHLATSRRGSRTCSATCDPYATRPVLTQISIRM
jgi:GNAT superfamily N-acetyltransferase